MLVSVDRFKILVPVVGAVVVFMMYFGPCDRVEPKLRYSYKPVDTKRDAFVAGSAETVATR